MVMTPSGFGAVLFGWFTAEIGRQPYVVYGLLAHGRRGLARIRGRGARLAPDLRRRLRLRVRLRLLLPRKALAEGPEPIEDMRGDDLHRKPKRPLSVPDESLEGGPGRRALPVR